MTVDQQASLAVIKRAASRECAELVWEVEPTTEHEPALVWCWLTYGAAQDFERHSLYIRADGSTVAF